MTSSGACVWHVSAREITLLLPLDACAAAVRGGAHGNGVTWRVWRVRGRPISFFDAVFTVVLVSLRGSTSPDQKWISITLISGHF